jgi:hypothetical protein
MSASKNTLSAARRKTSSTTGAYRGRVCPGGTPNQQFSLLIDKLAFSVLGLEQFEAWNEIPSTKLSPTERETRRRETWARFMAALNDPAAADAVIARLEAVLANEPELFASLLDVVFSDFVASDPARCGSPDWVVPPGLRVRRRPWAGPWNRTPWRHSTRTLARALGWPADPVMASIAGLRLVKVLVEVLWRRLGSPLNAPGATVSRHRRTGADQQRHTVEAVEASTADQRIDQCAERSTGTEQLRSTFGTRKPMQ